MILNEKRVEDNISYNLEKLKYSSSICFNKDNKQEVINFDLLREKMLLINKNFHQDYIDEAIKKIKFKSFDSIEEGNRHYIDYLKNGIPVKINSIDDRTYNIKLIDFENIDNNTFNYARQLEIYTHNGQKIIPDLLIYINGLPVSIIEIKSPEAKEKIEDARKQIINYSNRSKELAFWNVLSVATNGFQTKYGSLYSSFSQWWSWKKVTIDDEIIQDDDINEIPEIAINNVDKNIIGIFSRETFLNIIKNYCFFSTKENKIIKFLPAYHQYFAVEKIIRSIEKSMKINSSKGGVVWHTQGSGKSVTMMFLARRIKDFFKTINFKLIYVTDRKELNEQLFNRFEQIDSDYLYTTIKNMESRDELKQKLSNEHDFGIYTTTIQKFTENTNLLSDKKNIIIIADEAHRSHNNLETELEVDTKIQEIIEKKGYAQYIREAFPNAIYIGFTGTPLMGETKKTTDVFGDYIDKYPMNQAIYDGSTVPIHYEKRRMAVSIDENDLKQIDNFYNELNKMDNNDSEYLENAKISYVKKELLQVKRIFGDKNLIKKVIEDFWYHYESRKNVLNGKALFVAFDREIAFKLFNEMIKQKPEFKDKIILVITSSNKDSKEMMEVIPNDKQKEEYAKEFRSDNSKYKIAIVVDMWLTGFDVPDLDTLYLYKVIKWHNLMQTLARVNRTYSKIDINNSQNNKIKEDGLVVDYIGIWRNIADALKQFADINISKVDYDIEQIAKKLKSMCSETYKMFLEKLNLYQKWNSDDSQLTYESLIEGMEVILSLNKNDKDLFFKNVSKINRFYKLSISILDNPTRKMSQYLILLKNLIRNQNVEEAIDLNEMLKKLKEKLSSVIQVGDIEVSTILLNGRKDLAYVCELLQKELYAYKNTNKISNLKVKELENVVKSEINEFSKTNPIKGFELSQELRRLIKKYEEDKDFENFLSQLMEFSKEMIKGYANNEFIGDEHLQAFYSILADEKFKMKNYNSEVLKEITLKINNIVQKFITPQWWTNKKIRDKIHSEIKKMLYKEYNYPPNDARDISMIMIDEINKTISRNKKVYINEEER